MADTEHFWVDYGNPREINVQGTDDFQINIGSDQKIVVDKMYGPTAYNPLRVSISIEGWEWVIEQQIAVEDENGDHEHRWVEAARVPAMMDDDDA